MKADELSRVLYISEASPTGLCWRVPLAKKIKAGMPTGTKLSGDGYYRVRVYGELMQAHRVVAVLSGIMEDTTEPMQVDHIDGVRTHNTPSNLRKVTIRQNATNKATHRAGHLLGTARRGNRWQSRIRLGGKQISLGCFDTEEAAHLAYVACCLRNQIGLVQSSK